MKKRKKIIIYLIAAAVVVLAVFAGIGVKAGWFAGLADVISGGSVVGSFDVTVKVAEGSPPSIVPLTSKARVYATNDSQYQTNYGFSNESCTSKSKSLNTGSGDLKGETSLNSAKNSNLKEITISIKDKISDYYIRVDSPAHDPRAASCDFTLMNPDPSQNIEGVAEGQVWKITNPQNGGNYTAIFLYSGSDGTVEPPVEPTPEKGIIRGKVWDKSNNPIQGATVLIPGVGTRTTDSTGNYEYLEVNPGTYNMEVDKKCEYDKKTIEGIVVTAGVELTQTPIILIPGGIPSDKIKLVGRIEADGNPVSGVWVNLILGGNVIENKTTDSNGNYSICPVNPNLYTFKAGAQNYAEYTENLDLTLAQRSANGIITKNVNLTKSNSNDSFTLKGVVVDGSYTTPTSGPLAGVKVELLDRSTKTAVKSTLDGSPLQAVSGSDGKFTLDGVPLPQESGAYLLKGAKDATHEQGYLVRDLPTNIAPGASFDISDSPLYLFPKGTKFEISGKVILQGATKNPASSNVYLEMYDGQKRLLAHPGQSGDYSATLKSDEIMVPAKIFALYEEGGIENIGYYGNGRFTYNVMLDRQNEDINIMIVVAPTREIDLKFEDTKGNLVGGKINYNLYQVKKDEDLYIMLKGETTDGKTQLELPETMPEGKYYIQAVAEGYLFSQSEKYNADSIPDVITVIMYQEIESEVVYDFHFFQKPQDQKKFGDFFKELMGRIQGNENLDLGIPFYKTKITGEDSFVIDRTQWVFFPNSANPNFSLPPYLQGKIASIAWDETLLSGFANDEGIYRLTVRFLDPPDETTKKKWAKELFKNIKFVVDTRGTAGLSYSDGQFKKITERSENFYDIYIGFTLSAVDPNLLIGALLRTTEGVLIEEAKDNNYLIHIDNQVIKIKIETKSDSPKSEISSPYKKEVEAVNGLILLRNIPVGDYEVTSLTKEYPIDTRKNSFIIKQGEKQSLVSVGLCYSPRTVREYSYGGMNWLILGQYVSNRYATMPLGIARAKTMLNKAGISNVVYLGNAPATAVTSLTGAVKYCLNNQDQTKNGKAIAVSDGYLQRVRRLSADSAQAEKVITAKINYQAALLQYDELSDTEQVSFGRIYQALSRLSEEDRNKVMKFIFESSDLSKVDSRAINDASSNIRSLYALNVAAYKSKGLLTDRIDQLPKGQAKNVMSALVRYSIEKTDANSQEETNLYEPYQQKLSNTIYSVSIILNGNWLKEKYKNLNTAQKIRIKYFGLMANISQNRPMLYIKRQIQAFNNWLDKIRGLGDNGTINGVVLENGQPVANALVTINEKIAVTNNKGEFKIKKVQIGRHPITIKDRKNNKNYDLKNINQKAVVQKNKESSITIRVITP